MKRKLLLCAILFIILMTGIGTISAQNNVDTVTNDVESIDIINEVSYSDLDNSFDNFQDYNDEEKYSSIDEIDISNNPQKNETDYEKVLHVTNNDNNRKGNPFLED